MLLNLASSIYSSHVFIAITVYGFDLVARCILYNLGYNICQWIVECRFYFSITPSSSTKITDRQFVNAVYTSLVQAQSGPFLIHDLSPV